MKHLKAINKLPNKLSDLILLAVKDLTKVERRKTFEVDMLEWHTPTDTTCRVCFAGSVMACEFRLSAKTDPLDGVVEQFSDNDWRKFYALNAVRSGKVRTAVGEFYGYSSAKLSKVPYPVREVASYSDDSKQFKKDMRAIAEDLAAVGL